MASTATLYTAEVLGLATGLSRYPLSDDLPLRGSARSKSCGSSLELGLALDSEGRIARIGLKAHACAIGQASAAIFAAAAEGVTLAQIERAEGEISHWLTDASPLPDWPGLGAIAAARDYPARHGAILLAWRAALMALA